jgi:hypothetical protein
MSDSQTAATSDVRQIPLASCQTVRHNQLLPRLTVRQSDTAVAEVLKALEMIDRLQQRIRSCGKRLSIGSEGC